jgi:hypothetical protein
VVAHRERQRAAGRGADNDDLLAEPRSDRERLGGIGKPLLGPYGMHRSFRMTVPCKPCLEQVRAERRSDAFGQWRRFLARGGEAVQVDHCIGCADTRLSMPGNALFGFGYQGELRRHLLFPFGQPGFDVVRQQRRHCGVDERGRRIQIGNAADESDEDGGQE